MATGFRKLVDSVSKAKVDCGQSVLGFISSVFPSFDYVEWISQTGGGTLSAPTGCSPRDRGRLLAVDYGPKNIFLDDTVADCWQLAMIYDHNLFVSFGRLIEPSR